MTAKEYLKRYKSINDSINCKLDEIAHLRSIATRLSPTAMFDNGGNISDRVGRTVAKIVDLEKEINSQVDELIATRDEIKDAISKVEDERLRTLLTMRYINGDIWEKIAVALDVDVRWIYILHGRELQKISMHH